MWWCGCSPYSSPSPSSLLRCDQQQTNKITYFLGFSNTFQIVSKLSYLFLNCLHNVIPYYYSSFQINFKFISECVHLLFYQIYFRMCSPTFISNLFQNVLTYFFIKFISECVHLLLYQIYFRICSPTFLSN